MRFTDFVSGLPLFVLSSAVAMEAHPEHFKVTTCFLSRLHNFRRNLLCFIRFCGSVECVYH